MPRAAAGWPPLADVPARPLLPCYSHWPPAIPLPRPSPHPRSARGASSLHHAAASGCCLAALATHHRRGHRQQDVLGGCPGRRRSGCGRGRGRQQQSGCGCGRSCAVRRGGHHRRREEGLAPGDHHPPRRGALAARGHGPGRCGLLSSSVTVSALSASRPHLLHQSVPPFAYVFDLRHPWCDRRLCGVSAIALLAGMRVVMIPSDVRLAQPNARAPLSARYALSSHPPSP
mmetsp:Transcript_126903/g.320556  ORF Transcript_126903/g.320556 Transcript_126903/m.320556 type:complete len:230 (-) Transcript_126903:1216-1905(-)